MHNEHVQILANALIKAQSTTCLKEFHLISDNLGNVAGNAMATLLQTTSFLQKVTLRLGSWSSCAKKLTQVLAQNKSMTTCDVLLSARTKTRVHAKTMSVFEALAHNTTLKDLKVCQSSCSVAAEEDECNNNCGLLNNCKSQNCHACSNDTALLQSLQETLEQNHSLETVVLVDDCFYPIALSEDVQSQLEMNRIGLSTLLDGTNDDDLYNRTHYQQDYVEAIIKAQEVNNMDAVFTALINNPMLLAAANTATTPIVAQQQVPPSPVKSSTSLRSSKSSPTKSAGKMIRRTVLRMRNTAKPFLRTTVPARR